MLILILQTKRINEIKYKVIYLANFGLNILLQKRIKFCFLVHQNYQKTIEKPLFFLLHFMVDAIILALKIE